MEDHDVPVILVTMYRAIAHTLIKKRCPGRDWVVSCPKKGSRDMVRDFHRAATMPGEYSSVDSIEYSGAGVTQDQLEQATLGVDLLIQSAADRNIPWQRCHILLVYRPGPQICNVIIWLRNDNNPDEP